MALMLATLILAGVIPRFVRPPSPRAPYPWNAIGIARLGLRVQFEGWEPLPSGDTEGTPSPVTPPLEVVAQGPYCYVRNPLYLAQLAILVGWGFYLQLLERCF